MPTILQKKYWASLVGKTPKNIEGLKLGRVWNKGNKLTEEHKNNLKGTKGRKGWNKGLKTGLVPLNGFEKGSTPWNRGLVWDDKTKEKMKGKRPNASGLKNHNWKGGVSSENEKVRGSLEYKLWQDSVKNRDGNLCQKCGEKRVSKIMAHHILNFSSHKELRLAIDNGITLCRGCHKAFHGRYTVRNNSREQLTEFLKK